MRNSVIKHPFLHIFCRNGNMSVFNEVAFLLSDYVAVRSNK